MLFLVAYMRSDTLPWMDVRKKSPKFVELLPITENATTLNFQVSDLG